MDERLLRDLETLTGLAAKEGFREVRVRSEGIRLLLSSDPDAEPLFPAPEAVAPDRTVTGSASTRSSSPAETVVPVVATIPAVTAVDPAWHVVAAPNLGTFYRSPKPGSPPFVEVGQTVAAGAELCLIEVMKLFTSVRAAVDGTVRHVAVADAELVEGGQPLIYIETA